MGWGDTLIVKAREVTLLVHECMIVNQSRAGKRSDNTDGSKPLGAGFY